MQNCFPYSTWHRLRMSGDEAFSLNFDNFHPKHQYPCAVETMELNHSNVLVSQRYTFPNESANQDSPETLKQPVGHLLPLLSLQRDKINSHIYTKQSPPMMASCQTQIPQNKHWFRWTQICYCWMAFLLFFFLTCFWGKTIKNSRETVSHIG